VRYDNYDHLPRLLYLRKVHSKMSENSDEVNMSEESNIGFVEMGVTGRGFSRGAFSDLYGSPCSIQKSSLASDDAIWLGVDDVSPKVLHGDARKLGIETDATCGWVPYPIPKEVSMATRMHLSREQVAQLLPILERFVATGEI
jgi:hypothetical protein